MISPWQALGLGLLVGILSAGWGGMYVVHQSYAAQRGRGGARTGRALEVRDAALVRAQPNAVDRAGAVAQGVTDVLRKGK